MNATATGRTTKMTSRKYGVEIECIGRVGRSALVTALRTAGIRIHDAGYTHATTSDWKLVTDSSIQTSATRPNGYELVSPPMRGEEGFEQIKTVCRVLDEMGIKVNKSCGLHVHHDAGDFKAKHLANIFRLYQKAEAVLDTYMPESRRGNNAHWCRSVSNLRVPSHAGISDPRHISGPGSRYFKLNLYSFGRHGTVEFRHHSGTTNATKIINWIKLTQVMMERARTRMLPENNISLRQYGFQQVLGLRKRDNVSVSDEYDALIDYYTARAAELRRNSSTRRNRRRA